MRRRAGRRLTVLVAGGLVAGGMAGTAPTSVVAQAAPAGEEASSPARATRQVPLVLTGVTVIDVEHGARIPAQRIVIVGNRIAAMGKAEAVKIPKGARVVDARGKYLIPGLWDLHVHPWEYVDLAYPLFVANGVTGVRDAGSKVPLATFSRWKQEIAAGARVGPRLIVSGQAIDGDERRSCDSRDRRFSHPEGHHVCVATPAEARLVVDVFKTAGADMLKTYSLSRELYFAVVAEARRVGLPFGGHAYVPGLEASDSGASILDHQSWLDPNVCGDLGEASARTVPPSLEACTAAAQRLRRNNTWVALTISMPQRQSVHSRYMMPLPDGRMGAHEPASTADWARVDIQKVEYLTRMHAAGMPLTIGTDAAILPHQWFAVPGFSVHESLVALVLKAGMTPLEALQAATLNPARALRLTDSLGTVEAGKVADLVLLDADPLLDIWNTTRIRAVVADGRYFDRATLDRLLRAAEHGARSYRKTPVSHDQEP